MTKPDWRDPNMPVKVFDGKITNGQLSYLAAISVNATDEQDPDRPSWRNDPTYNLRRKK